MIQDAILQALRPMCFYRATDVALALGTSLTSTRRALVSLVRGGVIDRMKRPGDRTYIYLTRQLDIDLP